MKIQKTIAFIIVVALVSGGAIALNWLRTHQRLSAPGLIATPIAGSVKMKLDLPADISGFVSTNEPEDETVVGILPKDTSFAQRRYISPDGFWINANIVLMGADRTSIHRPEACLPAQGFHIDVKTNVNLTIHGERTYPLPVATWFLTTSIQATDGSKQKVRGIYIFWFVAHDEETTSHWQRVWWMTRDLLTTGVLQRWAYVSYFAICLPGQEDATFARMKNLIADSVPEFQLPPAEKTAPRQ